MRVRSSHFILPLLAMIEGATLAGRARAQTPVVLQSLPAAIDSIREAWGIPGMAVAVVQHGRVVFLKGLGFRDAERELPATSRTIFPLGSTTKSFTALALATLAERGELDLDVPVVNVVPGFRLHDTAATRAVTVRDLLSHQSGLPGQYDMLWLLSRLTRDELFDRLRFLEPNAQPRERFQYSNVGYSAAGVVFERVSGASWETYLSERIFRPLGMERTGFVQPVDAPLDDRALPYRRVGDATVRIPFSGNVAFERVALIAPAGGVASTAEDMARWLLFHLDSGRVGGEQLVAPGTIAELFSPQVDIADPGYRMLTQADAYGLGWAISEYGGQRVVDHGGNIEGFSSLVSLMPNVGIGVAVLSNTVNLAGYAVSRTVYDRVLGMEPRDGNGELLALYAMLDEARAQAAMLPAAARDEHSSPPLAAYAGSYRHPAFGAAEVSAHRGGLAVWFDSGVRAEVQPVGADAFKGVTDAFYLPVVEIRFHLGKSGVVEAFSLDLQKGAPPIRFARSGTAR